MPENQDEQNRLAVAIFIAGTAVALLSIENNSTTNQKTGEPAILTLLIGLMLIALLACAVFAVLFILSKAAELRYKPSLLKQVNYLVKFKHFFITQPSPYTFQSYGYWDL